MLSIRTSLGGTMCRELPSAISPEPSGFRQPIRDDALVEASERVTCAWRAEFNCTSEGYGCRYAGLAGTTTCSYPRP